MVDNKKLICSHTVSNISLIKRQIKIDMCELSATFMRLNSLVFLSNDFAAPQGTRPGIITYSGTHTGYCE